ncbi:hypothetical protein KIW84_055788 [Lathyrus oleraceus]|uniref:Retrotransposon gag domain-containing protein n=1 Tax=Pisum sativum TaxID=3888 RepID=A0A9D4WXM3_PEA|nr:hypothetical protein KIW84_055788 [Pisum sativum]
MAPPKPPNPSSRESIEEVVQTTHIHLDNAMNQTQQQLDERFDKAIVDLQQHVGQIHTRMDNEKQVANIRYESIIFILTKLVAQKEQQHSAIVHTTASSSCITQNPTSSHMRTTPISQLLTDWGSFTKALELRFGPSTYDNHQAELFKLTQDGFVVDYQTKFEQLGNQVVGLPVLFRASPSTQLPIKCLSQTILQERMDQGLCFNCDEKFILGHKYSFTIFLLLLVEDDSMESQLSVEASIGPDIQTNHDDTYFQLSTQALTDQFSPQTLKFKGLIGGLSAMVLVDTGNTHNIMQPRIAHHVNLKAIPIPQFSVMVGNGSHYNSKEYATMSKFSSKTNLLTYPSTYFLLKESTLSSVWRGYAL